jgi:radical SAM superfamily enzyme YgiQ (UPF0313 family)
MSKLKIAFIQARGNDRREYENFLGFAYIKSFLLNKTDGIEIEIFSDYQKLINYKPNIIGISSVTSTFESAKFLANKFKNELDVPIILGGYHITFLPSEIMSGDFDVGVIGEGEFTFLEIIEKFKKNNNLFDLKSLEEINSIVFKENSTYKINPERKLIRNLDLLPMPYHTKNKHNPEEGVIFSSRGCPYKCKYCTSHQFWKKVRFFSPQRIVDEVKFLIENFKVKRIVFLDDLFIFPKERFIVFSSLVLKEKLHQKVSFHGFVRANLLDEDLIEMMKRMNFDSIRFGGESGSDKILQMYKPFCSVDKNQRVIDLCIKHEIPVASAFMVGFIGETESDLMKTASFIKKNFSCLKPGGFYLFQPFPGSLAWEQIDTSLKNKFGKEISWDKFNLAFGNPDFDPENFLYFNEIYLKKEKFIKILKRSFPKEWLGKLN